MSERRTDLLRSLLDFESAVSQISAELSKFPWDSDEALVVFTREHAVAGLRRYLAGRVTARECEAWADAIESRDDIDLEPGFEEILGGFILDIANPDLVERLSASVAEAWIRRLEHTGDGP